MADSGVQVFVSKAPGEKCTRCRRYLLEVGLVAEHPELCLRCAGVVDGVEYDVHELAARRFDRLFQEQRATGADVAQAITQAGRLNR